MMNNFYVFLNIARGLLVHKISWGEVLQSFSWHKIKNALGVRKMRNNKLYTIFWLFVRLRAGGGAAPTLNSRYNAGIKSSLQLSSDDSEEETSFQYKHQSSKRGSSGSC